MRVRESRSALQTWLRNLMGKPLAQAASSIARVTLSMETRSRSLRFSIGLSGRYARSLSSTSRRSCYPRTLCSSSVAHGTPSGICGFVEAYKNAKRAHLCTDDAQKCEGRHQDRGIEAQVLEYLHKLLRGRFLGEVAKDLSLEYDLD